MKMQTTLKKTTTSINVKGATAGAESGARGAAPSPLPKFSLWEAKLLFYTLARESKDLDFARRNVLLLARLRGVLAEELRKVIDEMCEEGLECWQ
jgi:hypothetical protein